MRHFPIGTPLKESRLPPESGRYPVFNGLLELLRSERLCGDSCLSGLVTTHAVFQHLPMGIIQIFHHSLFHDKACTQFREDPVPVQ